MNRFKRIYILLGVLAAVCAATFGVMRYEERREKIKNSEEIILELAENSVKSLSWECGSESFSFRKDQTWQYEEDEAFPVDEEIIEGLLETFASFGVSFVIEDVEDYGLYGLDDPVCTIRMETDEESYEILLGNYSEMDSKRYVSTGDGNVYLVKEDPLERFDVSLSDLIKHDKTLSFKKAVAVRFAGTENYSVTYEENSAEDQYFTEWEGEKKPLDTSRVDSYLEKIRGLGLTNYVTYKASEEELVSYGLDSPELTVTVDCSYENEEGEEVTEAYVLHVSRAPDERDTPTGTEKDGDTDSEEEITAYVRVGESQIIYQIMGEDYKNIMAASYNDLRHQEVFSADFADITRMDISLEGNVYTLTSEGKDDEQIWHYEEEEVDISDVKTAFADLTAESFTEESPSQKEEISLSVYLDRENDTKILVELYRYDGETCLAVVDGEPVSLVDRSAVVDLVEAVYGIVLSKTK